MSCIRSQKIDLHKDIKSFNELIPGVVCMCVCVTGPPPLHLHTVRDVNRVDVGEVIVSGVLKAVSYIPDS